LITTTIELPVQAAALTCGGVHLEQTQVGVGHKEGPVGSGPDPQRPPTAGLLLPGACRTPGGPHEGRPSLLIGQAG